MMCLANLIGFGNGYEGMTVVYYKFMSLEGLLCFLFYWIVRNGWITTVQFRIRDNENGESNDKRFWYPVKFIEKTYKTYYQFINAENVLQFRKA